MPISIKVTGGALTKDAERRLLVGVRRAVQEIGGVTCNPFDMWQLFGSVTRIDSDEVAPSKNELYIDIGLAMDGKMVFDGAQQQEFVTQITELALKLTKGKISKENIYVIVLYGLQFWGVGGVSSAAGA